jgi:hypothetical protein
MVIIAAEEVVVVELVIPNITGTRRGIGILLARFPPSTMRIFHIHIHIYIYI